MLGTCSGLAVRSVNGVLNILASPTIEVRNAVSGALPSLFSDADGAVPINNPFTGNADGTFQFYCAGASKGYNVTITKDAYSYVLSNVAIGSAAYVDQEDISLPTISALGTSLIAATTESAAQQILGVEVGVDTQAHHANLDTLAGASAPTAAGLTLLAGANAAAQRTALAIAGKQAIYIPASAMLPRATNGCAPLATSAGAAGQPDVPYLAFDGAAKEYAQFLMRMPKSWNEGTVTGAPDWRRASGTGAADVVWGFHAVAVSDNETPVTNFGSDATVTDAASTTTANFCLAGETSACTIGGTPSQGDLVLFEVFRDGAAGGDTLNSVDAWLSGFTLYITTDETNDA